MLLSGTLSTIRWNYYPNFTSEIYRRPVWKWSTTFSSKCHVQAAIAKTVTKSNTRVVFYFSFNSLLLNVSENYYVDYCVAIGVYSNFAKAGV
jgi:hypothetical protein